jgi:flagellin
MAILPANTSGLNASYYSGLALRQLQKSDAKLASGSKLVGNDDAAGTAVSAKLDAVVRRLFSASEGAQNLISFSQTSSGELSNISKGLSRMGELAMRATNGTLSDSDRANLNTEYTQLRDTLSNQVSNASFNGNRLFDATQNISSPIDANGTTYQLNIPDVASDISDVVNSDISTVGTATTALSGVAKAIENIAASSAKVNADVSIVNNHIQNLDTARINAEAASSRIRDVDAAQVSVDRAREGILNQTSIAVLAQANVQSRSVLSLLR